MLIAGRRSFPDCVVSKKPSWASIKKKFRCSLFHLLRYCHRTFVLGDLRPKSYAVIGFRFRGKEVAMDLHFFYGVIANE